MAVSRVVSASDLIPTTLLHRHPYICPPIRPTIRPSICSSVHVCVPHVAPASYMGTAAFPLALILSHLRLQPPKFTVIPSRTFLSIDTQICAETSGSSANTLFHVQAHLNVVKGGEKTPLPHTVGKLLVHYGSMHFQNLHPEGWGHNCGALVCDLANTLSKAP